MLEQQVSATTEDPTSSTLEAQLPTCCHHWTIEAANGPVSLGHCRNCGEVREFKNYVEASYWTDEKAERESRPRRITIPRRLSDDPEDDS